MIQILKNYCPHQDDAVIDVQQDYNLAKAEGRRLLTQISTGSTPAQIRGFLRNFARFLFPDERSIESFVAQFCEAIDYINRLYEAYHEYNESFGCHLTNVGDYISQIAKKGN